MLYIIAGVIFGILIAFIVNRIEDELQKLKLAWVVTIAIVAISIIVCISLFLIPSSFISSYITYNLGLAIFISIITFTVMRRIKTFRDIGRPKEKNNENMYSSEDNNRIIK
jgi:protein-S-isoprenylcysteine O-methyltransferase Ste14